MCKFAAFLSTPILSDSVVRISGGRDGATSYRKAFTALCFLPYQESRKFKTIEDKGT